MNRLTLLLICFLLLALSACVQVIKPDDTRQAQLAVSSVRDMEIRYPKGTAFALSPKYLKEVSLKPVQVQKIYQLYADAIVQYMQNQGYYFVQHSSQAKFNVGSVSWNLRSKAFPAKVEYDSFLLKETSINYGGVTDVKFKVTPTILDGGLAAPINILPEDIIYGAEKYEANVAGDIKFDITMVNNSPDVSPTVDLEKFATMLFVLKFNTKSCIPLLETLLFLIYSSEFSLYWAFLVIFEIDTNPLNLTPYDGGGGGVKIGGSCYFF